MTFGNATSPGHLAGADRDGRSETYQAQRLPHALGLLHET